MNTWSWPRPSLRVPPRPASSTPPWTPSRATCVPPEPQPRVGAGDDLDEFGEIARLLRPLARDAPEALGLADDAAVIAPQPAALVVTTDTLVEGVHFLPDDPLDLVARKLLRVNLSDLAAKAAEPYGYLLNLAWSRRVDAPGRARFVEGLAADQARFGLRLFGGDTVRTPGPLTVGATLFGRAPAGKVVPRSGARPGDVLLVSGSIGDAGLGLDLLSGRLRVAAPAAERLAARYRTPEPRLGLRDALRAHAAASADVSDGLLADAGRIAEASGCRAHVRLEALPLSSATSAWLGAQSDEVAARVRLATAGDDYEVVCAARPGAVEALCAAAAAAGAPLTAIGRMADGAGVAASFGGRIVPTLRLGWTHGVSTPTVQT
ncbi:MAG: thiamine-phosphate kinase [Caulobacteraceae bacterium]|nr:thiamine-phosphate kinase [Caulobacter sp.]